MPQDRESLPNLIKALDGKVAYTISFDGSPEVTTEASIRGVEYDSRRVEPGWCFVALPGGNTDGHLFIPDALRRGGAVVVGEQKVIGLGVPYIQVENSRLALALISAAFYHYPARRMMMIGVTGTDGKTTTSTLIFNILQAAGFHTGMVSTVSAVIGDKIVDTGFHVTTPEAPDIQKYLAQMLADGHTHVVLEATSHGLAQYRVASCDFDVGVVTNITHEHLDYHGSYQAYREAKGRLFSGLANTLPKYHSHSPVAVLNRDDSSYGYLRRLVQSQVDNLSREIRLVSYGLHADTNVSAEDVVYQSNGLNFNVVYHGAHFPIQSNLIGEYNLFNCLAAISATMGGLNVDLQAVQEGINRVKAIPGRMERVEMGQDFLAIVDFAHTPNALQQALLAARQILTQKGRSGKLIAVFGSAGLRDQAKRRMMAEISAQLADFTILTAEDPRTESLDSILAEMAAGVEMYGGVEGKSYWRVPDRGNAIRLGVGLAHPGDLVIALGKGHEQSMCFGEIEYPWDDRIAMRSALAGLLHRLGPEMPSLPTRG